MQVYGDTTYERNLDVLRAEWVERAQRLARGPDPGLDALRGLLIAAGQAEQAAEDDLPGCLPAREAARWTAAFRAATDAAAAAFHARWNGGEGRPEAQGRVRTALEVAARALAGAAPPVPVTLKAPEGFAYYAVFPEQFAMAAWRWATEREAGRGPVLIAGVRSVGTTLSAIVAVTLAARGWEVRRLTLRPGGHHFERQATLPPEAVRGFAWGLVVDEGPGLSGSSMAAVAVAMRRAGLAPDRVAFVCGHGHGPGAAAPEGVRAVWHETPAYPAGPESPRWDGETLSEMLGRSAREALNGPGVERVEYVGGGTWRRLAYPRPRLWPAVPTRLERAKYRVTLADGTSILWRFGGLEERPEGSRPACLHEAAEAERRARAGWTVPPLAVRNGYVAFPWVGGRPLRRADGRPRVAEALGRYIACAAGAPLEAPEHHASLDRLIDMLVANVVEGVGPEAADQARAVGDRAMASLGTPAPSAGDGRLAPHEWRRAADGRLRKLDTGPHDMDHTVVGRQPVAWDLAGALVEWRLRTAAEARLLFAYHEAGGASVSATSLAFYRLAYAAFRMGECSLMAWLSADDADEAARHRRAEDGYRRQVVRLLRGTEPEPARAPDALELQPTPA